MLLFKLLWLKEVFNVVLNVNLPVVLQPIRLGYLNHLRVVFSVRECSYRFYTRNCKLFKDTSEMCSPSPSDVFFVLLFGFLPRSCAPELEVFSDVSMRYLFYAIAVSKVVFACTQVFMTLTLNSLAVFSRSYQCLFTDTQEQKPK